MKKLAVVAALAVGALLPVTQAGARPVSGHCTSPGFDHVAATTRAERQADANKNGYVCVNANTSNIKDDVVP